MIRLTPQSPPLTLLPTHAIIPPILPSTRRKETALARDRQSAATEHSSARPFLAKRCRRKPRPLTKAAQGRHPALTPGVPPTGGSTAQLWDGHDQSYTTTPTPVDSSPQTTVRFSMQMTRQQLYGSWQAIANLAGVVDVRIEAQRPEGFDPNWLPLEEAGVELDR